MPYTVEEYYGHFRPTFKTAFILIMNIFVLAVNASLGKHKKLKTAKPGCLISMVVTMMASAEVRFHSYHYNDRMLFQTLNELSQISSSINAIR